MKNLEGELDKDPQENAAKMTELQLTLSAPTWLANRLENARLDVYLTREWWGVGGS